MYLSQSVDYLGFLNAKLRDLKGWSTLVNELIQNADDATGSTEIVIEANEDGLVVTNDATFSDCGSVDKPICDFDAAGDGRKCCDFHAFRRVASGHKRQEEDTTGAFGIGFISVYQITDRPTLRSGNWYWQLHPAASEDKRIFAERTVDATFGTRFEFPWSRETSELRERLGMEPVPADVADRMAAELSSALSRAAPFLKRLRRLELRLRGSTVSLVQCDRDPSSDEILVDCNGQPQLWKRISSRFDERAEALRAKFGAQIEAKRKSFVTVAVPMEISDEPGLIYASLPTEQHIDLPVLINADFYPSTDRKRILFDTDFQGAWNRSAIQAAGAAFANSLPTLKDALRPEVLWHLLSKAQSLAGAAQDEKVDDSFASFWANAKPALQTGAYVWLSTNAFSTSHAARQNGASREAGECLPLFESIGLNVVHSSLRSHFNALREVGTRDLDLDSVTAAMHQAGLNNQVAMLDAPAWLRVATNRATLSLVLEGLLQKAPKDKISSVHERLLDCSLWLTAEGALSPASQIWRADIKTRRIFATIDEDDIWAAEDGGNTAWLMGLLESFDMGASIEMLANATQEELSAIHKADPKWLHRLFEWLEARHAKITDDPATKIKLQKLPIWPTGRGLHPLAGLSVPGPFEDPLRLAQLLDAEISVRFSTLLITHLGAKSLDLRTYLGEQVPLALSDQTRVVTADTKRRLLKLLTREFGKIRDDARMQAVLGSLPLVECEDGSFRRSKHVYLRTPQLVDIFGDDPTRFTHPSMMKAASSVDVLKWLGVSELPIPSDFVLRVNSILGSEYGTARLEMQSLFRGLVDAWPQIARQSAELVELKTKAWLPTSKHSGWASPSAVFASFRDFLFASQVQFLDVPRNIQAQAQRLQGGQSLFDFLGVRGEPTPAQVVAHLLHEAKTGSKVNPEVFAFLDQHHQEPCVSRLHNEACLSVVDVGYVSPNRVFSGPHRFGRFRYRLGPDWLRFTNLLRALSVRDQPSASDAVLVLEEMADEYADRRQLSGEDCEINLHCWLILAAAGPLQDEHLARLNARAVIPNANGFLRQTADVYFEDRPGLAAKFDEAVQACTIRRPETAWLSMACAGVRDLSKVVETRIVECDDPSISADWSNLLTDRWPLVRRVMTSLQHARPDAYPATPPEIWRTSRLVICYELANRVTTAEDAGALFDRESSRLFLNEQRRGAEAALARELAFLLQPDSGSGPLAAALKELLTADTAIDASAVLSDLGFADVQLGSGSHVDTAPGVGLDSGESNDLDLTAHVDDESHDKGDTDAAQNSSEANSTEENANESNSGKSGSGSTDGFGSGKSSSPEVPAGRSTRPATGKKFVLRSYVQPAKPATDQAPNGEGNKHQLDVDRRGTELVMAFERRAGREPKKMPHFHEGYDVESFREDGSLDRYIEIKSLSAPWSRSSVGMSDSQYLTARRRRLMFWLYVVEGLDTLTPKIHMIRDPATRVVDYRFDDGWREAAAPGFDDTDAQSTNVE